MSTESGYSIHSDVKFKPLELIDIRKLHEACENGGGTSWFVNRRKVSDEEYRSANSQYKM